MTNGRGKIKYSCVYLLTNLVLAPKWPIISGQLGNHTQGPCFTLLGKKLCYPNLSQSIFDFHGFLQLRKRPPEPEELENKEFEFELT